MIRLPRTAAVRVGLGRDDQPQRHAGLVRGRRRRRWSAPCDVGDRAAVAAMLGDIDPPRTMRGPIEFKKHVAGVILRRAIAQRAQRQNEEEKTCPTRCTSR